MSGNQDEYNKKMENIDIKELSKIFDSIIAGVAVVDAQTDEIINCNLLASKMIGLPKEEIIGKLCSQFMCPTEKGNCSVSDLAQNVNSYECVLLNAEGKNIPILKTITPTTLQNNPYLIASFIDITELKKKEKESWEINERYRALVNDSVLGITVIDPDYKIITTNSTFCKLFKKSAEEFIGKYCYKEYEKRDEVCPHCPGRQAMATGAPADVETQAVLDDGTQIHVRNRAVPFFSHDGQLKGFIEMIENIDQRKKMEEALKENKERFRIAAENESERAAELERINEELRRTEEKYRVQFERSLDAIFLADVETGLIIDCNSAATRLVERDKFELISQHQRILHPPEKIDGEFSVTFRKHSEENSCQTTETKVITKSGQIKDVVITPTLLEIDGKKVLQGIFRDITERKRSEEFFINRTQQAIRYQNVQLKLAKMVKDDFSSTLKKIVEEDAKALEVERVGIWFFNSDRTEIICEDLYSQNENVHQKGLSLASKDYPIYFKALEESRTIAANDARKDSRTCEFTEKYLVPQGITSMMDIPIWLRGKVVGIICHEHTGPKREWSAEEQDFVTSIADMVSLTIEASEHRKTEEALKRSEERFKHVAENSGDWIWEVDTEGLYTYSSPVVKKVLGYEPEEIIGKKHFYDLFEPNEKVNLKKAAFDSFAKKESFRGFINSNVHKDGSIVFLETSGTPILDERGNLCGYQGSDRDITERKEIEQRQSQLLNQLENVNEELRSFGYIVSHDLKAPLRGVKVLVDWICSDYKDKLDEEGKQNMDLLVSRIDRMHNLIDGILKYSRVGRSKEDKSQVNLNELLIEIIDIIAPPDNIEITIEDELPVMACERTRITQVFQNLLSNAVKYMDKPQGSIKIGCIEERDFWKFSVKDNGPGIKEKYYDKIFQMFQTLSSRDKFESTGIGLTVVKKIIDLYGGKIWIESQEGQGSTFIFTIPKQQEQKERIENEKLQTNSIS